MKDEIRVIQGGIVVDDRGEVSFVNDFGFDGVRRFYVVSNHKIGFVRAWHAHKKEAKFVFVVSGAALFGAVKVDDFQSPSPNLIPEKFVLSSKKPQVLYVPKGYANGFMSLTEDLKIIFFSTSTLDESINDDFRFDARLWDIWHVKER